MLLGTGAHDHRRPVGSADGGHHATCLHGPGAAINEGLDVRRYVLFQILAAESIDTDDNHVFGRGEREAGRQKQYNPCAHGASMTAEGCNSVATMVRYNEARAGPHLRADLALLCRLLSVPQEPQRPDAVPVKRVWPFERLLG